MTIRFERYNVQGGLQCQGENALGRARDRAHLRRGGRPLRVLVTGGSGYIGIHTVRALLDRGDDVVILDRQAPPGTAPVSNALTVVGDVADADLVDAVISRNGIDGVIHLAAYKSVEESWRKPHDYFANNAGATFTLLDVLARRRVKSIVFSSTCAVYGMPDSLPVTEATPTRPENPYGASKLMAEDAIRWFDAATGLRHMTLRYFNAAGAALDGRTGEDWSDATNLLPIVMKAASGVGEPVRIFGTDYPTSDGTAVRDYVHVVDLAQAHLLALDLLRTGHPSVVMNVGTGRGTTVRDVIATVERATGLTVPTVEGSRRAGDAAAIWADTSRSRQVLRWRPRHDLESIVRSAWQWHSREDPTV